MKKLILWVLLVLLCGCQSTNNNEYTQNPFYRKPSRAEVFNQYSSEEQMPVFGMNQPKKFRRISFNDTNQSEGLIHNSGTRDIVRSDKSESFSPIVQIDGTILFPYGLSDAEMICSHLRVCTIRLEKNEEVIDIRTGDTHRWEIGQITNGDTGGFVTNITVKPIKEGSFETNMVIATNKRRYEIALICLEKGKYTPSIGFYYPKEFKLRQQKRFFLKREREKQVIAQTSVSLEKLHFYKIKGKKNKRWYPVRVFDDGKKVFIQMREDVRTSELPSLFVVGADGKQEIVNYRYKHPYFVVDKIFDEARLLIGNKKKDIIRIIR